MSSLDPQLTERNFVLLQQLAEIKEEHWGTIISAHPGLLTPSALKVLVLRLATVNGSERARLERTLVVLDSLRRYLQGKPEDYPIGAGPIETAWQRVLDGEINEKYAEQLVRDPSVTTELSLAYLEALSTRALDLVQRHETDQALQLNRLILAAIEAAEDANNDYKVMRHQAYMDWLLIAHKVLLLVPDGRILRNARDIGERMVVEMQGEDNRDKLGSVLYRLGSLHLDPYLNFASPDEFQSYWQDFWLEYDQAQPVVPLDSPFNSKIERSPDGSLQKVKQHEVDMPPMDEALKSAERYYRAAAQVREGHLRGRTFKALAQTLIRLHGIGGQLDRADLSDVCKRALQFLDPNQNPQDRLEVLNIIKAYKLIEDDPDHLLSISLDEAVHLRGPNEAIEYAIQACLFLQSTQPHQALNLLISIRPLVKQYGTEKDRIRHWSMELELIVQTLPVEVSHDLLQKSTPLAVKMLIERRMRERWNNLTSGTALIALASYSPKYDEEAIGLTLLEEAAQLAPHFWDEHREAFTYLRAGLTQGAGVNYEHAGLEAQATAHYADAMQLYLDLPLFDESLRCLRYIDDLLAHGDGVVGRQVIMKLAPLALKLEKQLGASTIKEIHSLCKHAYAALAAGPFWSEVALTIHQIAKGLFFAAILASGSHYDWKNDQVGQNMLDQIAQAEALARTQEDDGDVAFVQQKLDLDLLNAYIGENEQYPGGTIRERLANLQRRYDAHMNTQLFSSVDASDTFYLTIKDIQTALDDRTVLIDFYVGTYPKGYDAMYLLILTQDDCKAAGIPYPGELSSGETLLSTEQDGQTVSMSSVALIFRDLREDLVEDPGLGRRVSAAAAEDLAKSIPRFMGSQTMQCLEQFRAAGKDHLCLVPHGPLHYYPLHLIGQEDAPIAEQWCVTYLPNLQLLTSRQRQPAIQRRQELAAIGLTFEAVNPFRLPTLPQSLSEVTTIANLYGAPPIVDNAATKATVYHALETARFAHLSTHGKHNVEAPAFQCLYLFPDGDSDGRLFAYEILSMDLRGLDLLTLSACETALGRFDREDNLRGLPAAFLLAGASTVVGTLWEVEAGASERFFSILYRELQANRSKLDAFTVAQHETRKAFPDYRDWGPFYLMGEWR